MILIVIVIVIVGRSVEEKVDETLDLNLSAQGPAVSGFVGWKDPCQFFPLAATSTVRILKGTSVNSCGNWDLCLKHKHARDGRHSKQ